MKNLKPIGILLLSLGLASCSEWISDDFTETKVEFSFDIVKGIAEDRNSLNSDDGFEQESYKIGPKSRLIMSLSHLNDHIDDITIDEHHRVWAQVTLTQAESREGAMKSMRLCPISRSWMMLSNWDRAHPYGRSGKWSKPGGDFIADLCQNPLNVVPANTAVAATEGTTDPVQQPSSPLSMDPKKVYFDITDWFQNYVKGRRQNFGLILLSEEEVEIEGDLDSFESPRILWLEFRNPWAI